MNLSNLITALSEMHNALYNVTVSKEDIIRVGDSLRALRNIVSTLSEEGVKDDREPADTSREE